MAAPVRSLMCANSMRILLRNRVTCGIYSPASISVRHRTTVDLRNPQPRPLPYRILYEICKPILPPRLVDPARDCAENKSNRTGEEEFTDYDKFLLTQVTKIFEENEMVIAVHRLSMKAREHKKLRLRLFRKNLGLKVFPNKIYLKYFEENPRYTNLSPLFVSEGYVIVGKLEQLPDVIKLMKKDPYCSVLGGLIGDRILNRANLLELAAVPNIASLHSQLSAILNQSLSRTKTLLESHQQQLIQNLDLYREQNSEEKS